MIKHNQNNYTLVAERFPIYRHSIANIIEENTSMKSYEAGSLSEIQCYISSKEDIRILLLDCSLPGLDNTKSLDQLKETYPSLSISLLVEPDQYINVRRCLPNFSIIPKSLSMNEFLSAFNTISRGEVWSINSLDHDHPSTSPENNLFNSMKLITPSELIVLKLLSKGLLNKQIAYQLDLSEATIKAHISKILKKTKFINRTQLALAYKKIDRITFLT